MKNAWWSTIHQRQPPVHYQRHLLWSSIKQISKPSETLSFDRRSTVSLLASCSPTWALLPSVVIIIWPKVTTDGSAGLAVRPSVRILSNKGDVPRLILRSWKPSDIGENRPNRNTAFEFEERLKKKEQNGEPTLGLRPPRVADDETFVSDSWTLVTILLPFLLLRFLRNLTYHLHHLHHSVPSDQNFLFFYWSSTTQGDQTEKSLRRWS